jgi:molybdate transport system substrate-binding protein
MVMDRQNTGIACLAFIGMLAAASPMNAADIVVLSTTSAREALTELVPMFQSITGHTVSVSYSPGSGMGDRIRSGAAGDLLIAPAEFSDPLIKEGRLIAGSRVDFARSGSAVAVRAGTPKPDIGSPESFKQALIAARTVSYSRGASGLQFVEAIARLGIADVVKQKSVLPESGELVGAVVARGAAEIGIQQLSELLPVPGIDIVGTLPVPLQKEIIYGTSALPNAKAPEAAKVFAIFLTSTIAGPVLKKHGLDPM